MPRCSSCGTVIVFGGVREDDARYCNEKCRGQGFLAAVARQIPEELVAQRLEEVHQGACPKCGGPGPIDVHTAHTIWSAVWFTSLKQKPQVSCRACGIKAGFGGILFCGIFGWWGFPWGFLLTPVQIIRNVVGIFSPPDPDLPTEKLENVVRGHLAEQVVEASKRRRTTVVDHDEG